jgi:hypothetical protein
LPPGDVNRKMDHENHSILTGPDWAGAGPAHAASITATAPPNTQRHPLAMMSPPSFRISASLAKLRGVVVRSYAEAAVP